MQLTYYTDYSLRVLMHLAIRRNRIANISEIAERYDISRNHLVKVVHNLARGGFIKSYRGKGGGIELARDPARSISARLSATPRDRLSPSSASMSNGIAASSPMSAAWRTRSRRPATTSSPP